MNTLKETHSVDVVVLDQHSPNFPGFFSPRTDYKAPHHTGSLAEIADIQGWFDWFPGFFSLRFHSLNLVLSTRLGLPNGTLIACPIPEKHTGEGQMIAKAVDKALEEAKEAGIRGKGLSPYILDRVSQGTGSASLKASQ